MLNNTVIMLRRMGEIKMFVGKWNKSVILTYIGAMLSVLGMFCAFHLTNGVKHAMICMMFSGICDMFDGVVARKCKRTEEEKHFGVELDSLVDVISFVIFPIIIAMAMGLNQWYHLLVFLLFSICGVARLAYFNILVEDSSKPVKYYQGLPVTFIAFLYPIFYIFKLCVSTAVLNIIFTILLLLVAFFFVLKVKVPKTRGIGYLFFLAVLVIVLSVYILIL